MPKVLRIGVDVGGQVHLEEHLDPWLTNKLVSTNTDGVVLDPTKSLEPSKGVIAW